MPFKIVRNDITKVKADVIVNTANPNPICASGTDLAIYEAAGKEKLLAERANIGKIARICLRNLVFREKTLKQYILMSIQNMKAIRTEIRAGSEDLKVISIITI